MNHSRKSGLLDFDPADCLKVSAGNAQAGALAGEVSEDFFNTRHADQVHLAALIGYSAAHGLKNSLCTFFHDLGRDASLFAGFAKNGSVGIAG